MEADGEGLLLGDVDSGLDVDCGATPTEVVVGSAKRKSKQIFTPSRRTLKNA